ncbi:uncharacterized protein LOC143184056 [Calliopsis andreniformis]|uniref:uncharacterized protein LOC143184056 n=1 Tax=Calliopsis andreniformis TaxID=337506 RepID=UPI003FCE498F
MYTCSGCKYESNRKFNVIRHANRIHWKQKLRVCCGKKFYTKGDYYIHCEQEHPETRINAITSRTKYKITRDALAIPKEKTSYLRVQQRFSERIRNKNEKNVKSKVSLKYSVTYKDVDIEDVPLISFITDHRLKSYLKRLSSSKLTNKVKDKQKEKTNQTIKIAISSEQSIENITPKNGVENVRTTVSNSAISSFSVELPTKKLLLQRFRTSVIQVPFREENNNIREQVNFAQQKGKENAPSVYQNRLKYSKRMGKADKENVPNFMFSLEHQLDIKLDSGITVPMVTQVHRDFLASIDFDKYKIF